MAAACGGGEIEEGKEHIVSLHLMQGHQSNVLVMCIGTVKEPAASPSRPFLFSGSSEGDIALWDMEQHTMRAKLIGHTRAIFALSCSGHYLFSASSDNSVRVWSLSTLKGVALLRGMAGNIFSLYFPRIGGGRRQQHAGRTLSPLALSDRRNLHAEEDDVHSLLIGCQDTSIRKLDVSEAFVDATAEGRCKEGAGGVDKDAQGVVVDGDHADLSESFTLKDAQIIRGHSGFVYALEGIDDKTLISGAGDGCIKMWNMQTMRCRKTIKAHNGAVFCICKGGERFFSGGQDFLVKVWDRDTFFARATLTGHRGAVLCISMNDRTLLSGDSRGDIRVWDRATLLPLQVVSAHTGSTMSLLAFENKFFSGGQGGTIKVWVANSSPVQRKTTEQPAGGGVDFLSGLRMFVSIQSIAGDASKREECWKAAKFTSTQMSLLGFDTTLVDTAEGRNPVVLGRLGRDPTKITVTFYERWLTFVEGHYDVYPIASTSQRKWESDPFTLTGVNGYYYGRGVSDNKGPIMAMLFAMREVLDEDGSLPVNVVMVIEGEEERSSEGFETCVESHSEWFEGTDIILISNTTWIGEELPCVHYGLRGRLNISATIKGAEKILHSGEHGGAVVEPMIDLAQLVSSLVIVEGRDRSIAVEGFYDDVRTVTKKEVELYEAINFDVEQYCRELGVSSCVSDEGTKLLQKKWREPSMSVHCLSSDDGVASTSIPPSVCANVSFRLVPNQDPNKIFEKVQEHLKKKFDSLQSPNELTIEKVSTGDWWISDHDNQFFQAMVSAVKAVWDMDPLLTRGGGTIPTTRFLERTLKAPVIHLPMGQSTDSAHLPNEKIRILNLTNGLKVISEFIRYCGGLPKPPIRHLATSSSRCTDVRH